MRIGWGWKIAILYSVFVTLILSLVIASSHQHFDLVSGDYYDDEVGYQKVIDAGKNQSMLSAPIMVHADANDVVIDFPGEFKSKQLSGNIQFYSPVNAEWDRSYKIVAENNSFSIPRGKLQNTRYKIKITCSVEGKNYYQESDIMLHS